MLVFVHARREEFDATELRRARASLEPIDLRALEFGPDLLRSASTTIERATHLHISVPAITRGTLARTHELKNYPTDMILKSQFPSVNS